ncbi:hypothetical protein PIB30_098738 [Stylosanthes scabra]|uniref:Uncharacterized protein n=1 Tax=Stylosanthes scabra TaxID=79078 RepID=A0ABU6RWM0_9FABA|nr:hypothetical protein [Stylosanthes scabra]
MEAKAIDTLVAQNKALINLLSNKLGNVQLASANTQIGPCDLCGIHGHSSEACAAIPEQQSSMGSGIIYYEYAKREKFEDYDIKADAELGTFKIRRYHFDNESFVHPLHSVRFDPDRPYEIPIEALMANKILSASKDKKSSAERPRLSRCPLPHYSQRTMPVAQRERSTSSIKGTRSFRHGTTSSSVRKLRSWELISPSKGWMCDANDEKEIGGMDPSEKEESSDEDPEMEEEDPEETELGRAPEPSPLRSSQASVPDEPVEAADRQSTSHDGSSYSLSGVWQPQSSSPSS